MEKLKMHSPDMTQENIARIRELFPNCVTEAHGENNEVTFRVDFDLLRQELAGVLVEGGQERYRLDWPGKRQALLTANAPIAKTLRPCREESVDFDSTKNLYIEGDNLDALKLLQESYLGKVKMIYIDPPYNTGNDFVYRDDFVEDTENYLVRSNQKDEEGNRLVQNTEANGRFHSDWLMMMYPRLKLARNLLRDDGALFISVGDEEFSSLKKIADEIFGENNFLGTILWKKKTNGNNMGFIPPVHDYIIAFKKRFLNEKQFGFPISKEYTDKTYKNPDNDQRGKWTTSDLSANHKGPYFKITNPITKQEFFPPDGRYWVFNEIEVLKRIQDGRIIFGMSGTSSPVQKKFLSEREDKRLKAESWWDKHGMNEDGSEELTEILNAAKLFPHPKPAITIKHLCNIATSESTNDIILDFFSGSATTAHAVMQLNAEDGGNRQFIMVQLPEPCGEKSEAFKAGYSTIAEIGKERIRRVGKKILEGECNPDWNKDIGFRVLKVDSSCMEDVYYTPDQTDQKQLSLFADNIKADRRDKPEDLLYQVLIDWGVELHLPIRPEAIQGKKVFFVDEDSLAACFDSGINETFIQDLAKRKPLRVVFRDAGFASDAARINAEQIFRQLSPHTEVKVL